MARFGGGCRARGGVRALRFSKLLDIVRLRERLASFCVGSDVYFVEQMCVACGEEVCYEVGKDRESWGDEIELHL